MRVSTYCCSSSIPWSAARERRAPSNPNGLVTTPTVRMFRSRAIRAMTGAAPVPVPPPIPAVMNTMWAPSRCRYSSSAASSAAALPTSGLAPAPRPCVICGPNWIRRSARLCISCCASVFATTNSTPWRFAAIMLSTALVPPPPTPITVMRGLKSVCVVCGMVRFRVISTSLPVVPNQWNGCYDSCLDSYRASDALLQKIDDAPDKSPRPLSVQIDVVHDAALACRPGQQAGGGGEGGARCRIGQAAQRDGTAQTHLLAEDAARHLAHAAELTCAAGQHDTRAGRAGKAGAVQPLFHHLERLFQTRADDVHHHAARHLGDLVLLLANQRHRQHFAFIVGAGLGVAVQSFQPLRMCDRRRQQACEIIGDVHATDRKLRGVQQLTLGEHRHAGGATAHVDNGRTEFALVGDQRC